MGWNLHQCRISTIGLFPVRRQRIVSFFPHIVKTCFVVTHRASSFCVYRCHLRAIIGVGHRWECQAYKQLGWGTWRLDNTRAVNRLKGCTYVHSIQVGLPSKRTILWPWLKFWKSTHKADSSSHSAVVRV